MSWLLHSQERALPLRVVPHPPPISLSTKKGFLVPKFDVESKRSVYAACVLPGFDPIEASVSDSRFRVQEEVVNLGKDCTKHSVRQKRFRAVRNDGCAYANEYKTWSEGYDIAVTLSPVHCLEEAIEDDNPTAVRKINDWAFGPKVYGWEEQQKACPVVRKAAALEPWDALGFSEFLLVS